MLLNYISIIVIMAIGLSFLPSGIVLKIDLPTQRAYKTVTSLNGTTILECRQAGKLLYREVNNSVFKVHFNKEY